MPCPRVQGAKRGGDRLGSQASVVHFGVKFITQKLLVTPNLVTVGHLIGSKSGSGRTWPWCASGDFQGEFIKSKLQCMFQIVHVWLLQHI